MMRILVINKFLFANGGSETYIFELAKSLMSKGHEVQFFGMKNDSNIVGNSTGAYTKYMDFHEGSFISKISYPIRVIYSMDSRRKIRKVLDDFKPNVCHINNFNYQLTPSIIDEIVSWRRKQKCDCRIVYTAHDYQLICPNHMLNNPITHINCEKCIETGFVNCIKYKCIHGSKLKSVIGFAEASYWNRRKTYSFLDRIICCSQFMKEKIDTNPILRNKTIVLHNFVSKDYVKSYEKKKYVLYFGRFSWEKGVRTLIGACKILPDIDFVFAGSGEYADDINEMQNAHNVGFQSGESLAKLIAEASFSVCPSECYENCPFAVLESQKLLTPVIGARIGGIPELIENMKTGLLFESGNSIDLAEKIRLLWDDKNLQTEMSENCKDLDRKTVDEYTDLVLKIYEN